MGIEAKKFEGGPLKAMAMKNNNIGYTNSVRSTLLLGRLGACPTGKF